LGGGHPAGAQLCIRTSAEVWTFSQIASARQHYIAEGFFEITPVYRVAIS